MAAIKLIMSSKATGQMVLNVDQGTVGSVVWRERKGSTVPDTAAPAKISLDTAPAS
jgi:hypothetical protein